MAKNPWGVILLRDELAGWLKGLNQYKGKGSDEQFYLSAWSGEYYVVDRVDRDDPLTIPHAYLAVAGGTQPKILEKLLTDQRHEEGFASRLLICYPPEVQEKWTDEGIDPSLVEPVTVQGCA